MKLYSPLLFTLSTLLAATACGRRATETVNGNNAAKQSADSPTDDSSDASAPWSGSSTASDPYPAHPPYPDPLPGPSTTPPVDDADPVDFTGPVLYWTEGWVVRAARLDGTGKKTIAGGSLEQNFPHGLAVDAIANKIYWADNMVDAIYQANPDGSARVEVYRNASDKFSNPSGIAVDHAAGKIFWTEQGAKSVHSANLDGSSPTAIYTAQFPTGVSAAGGDLFFTDNGDDSMRRGDYAGATATSFTLSTDALSNPSAVTIDGDDVYWAQGGGIYKMKKDGTTRVLVATAQYPGGVAVDPTSHRVYFTDNADDTVTYVNADGSGRTVVYKATDIFSNPRGVAIRP